MVFAQQVYGLGKSGDVLLAISTSGKSANICNAVITAKAFGLKSIALTGRSGGDLAPLADVAIKVPSDNVAEIQELHLPVYHWLSTELEAAATTLTTTAGDTLGLLASSGDSFAGADVLSADVNNYGTISVADGSTLNLRAAVTNSSTGHWR